ncbi:hypothetical protein BB450_08095 [Helicobacter pylori]|nr:hypothetical protein BB450_08095 [Helicobacter pylori]
MRSKTIKQKPIFKNVKNIKILIKLMVGIKLKATYRFNQNQSVKSNQAVKLERSFKSVLACFHQDG